MLVNYNDCCGEDIEVFRNGIKVENEVEIKMKRFFENFIFFEKT